MKKRKQFRFIEYVRGLGGQRNGSQTLFDEFLFSCSLKATDVSKPRSEICIPFLSSEKWTVEEAIGHYLFSYIIEMALLVMEFIINLN